MAHQRTTSSVTADALKEPHSVSLKVLRLSRPSLATQSPLPIPSASSTLAQSISPTASLAYPIRSLSPQPSSEDNFILSPLLTLPPAFGNAYVGETFACTLCANNELLPATESTKEVTGVRIEAEMKTPSLTFPLSVAFAPELTPASGAEVEKRGDEAGRVEKARDLEPRKSLQGIVEFHLKEAGSHVLAVTVSYTETGPTSGRVRTFRKLYQFVTRECLIVRTKIGALPVAVVKSTTLEGKEETQIRKRWALEAQLEHSGEDMIVLESVSLEEKSWCKATGLNWDTGRETNGLGDAKNPTLGPKDVQQICFLVEQIGDEVGEEDVTGRLIMGMLHIAWRGSMGNRGSLSTSWLGTRLRY